MTLFTLLRAKKRLILMTAILSTAIIVIVTVVLIYLLMPKTVRAAVVSNGYGCSDIGIDILQKGGNAVDAAIATLFCEGVSMPISMGLGGGFLMTVYNKNTGKVDFLNSREVAPAKATKNMYVNNTEAGITGPLSVAVPGELVGYWVAYKKYGGSLPWKDLVQPTIDLCKNGIYVTSWLEGRFEGTKNALYADPVLREVYINPKTNETYKQGQYFKNLKLAETLEVIAKEGGYALHNGSLTENFVKDIQDAGGIIIEDDLKNYEPIWRDPIKTTLSNGQTLYTAPLPGSGVILSFMLNILDEFLDLKTPRSVENYQKMVEAFKFGYGWRTNLGDDTFINVSDIIDNLTSKKFAKEVRSKIFLNQTFTDESYYGAVSEGVSDHGTAHLSVLAENGDAVSVTSTINNYWGSKFASKSTGIVLNDEMDDFSSPNIINSFNFVPSSANFIVPGKRPLSSMSPSIILDENKDVVFIVGAAGGSKIPTSVIQIIISHLWYEDSLEDALSYGRIHHQLFPMAVNVEERFNIKHPEVVEGLSKIGHRVDIAGPSDGFSAATAISCLKKSSITGGSDPRRPGTSTYTY